MNYIFPIFVVLAATSAHAAISTTPTNVYIQQRGETSRVEDRNLLGSSNLWEVWAFNGSGALTTLTAAEWFAGSGYTIGATQITDGSILNADINASAAIALSKLAELPATAAAPSLTGVGTVGGTWIETPASMAALAVDVTKALNLKTDSTSRTITWSGTPTAGQYWGLMWQNTGAGIATITLPAGVLDAQSAASVASFTVPAASGGNNGRRHVVFAYTGVNYLIYEGEGGSGSGFPLTANADFAGFDATNVGALEAATLSGNGSLITDLAGTALPSFIPARNFGKITTAEALEYEPTTVATTTGATTTVDTTKSYSVVTLNETTETIAFSGVPAKGTPLIIEFVAHTSDCTVTVPSVYSTGYGGNRTSFTIRANKPALWQLWRSNGSWRSFEPVELGDLPANASPTTAYLVETSDPSTGASGKSTLAEVKVGMSLGISKSGTFGTPTTTNPLAPTWTGEFHAVYYGATGEIDLPAAASYTGRGIAIYNTGAFTITVDPNASEVIVRDGTAQTGGVTFTLSTGAGNFVNLISDGEKWITLGFKGTLSVGS